MLATRGQPYHARHISCNINFNVDQALDHDQHVFRKSGWGSNIKELTQPNNIKQLPKDERYHVHFWDTEKTLYHMKTTGLFAGHVDKQFGFGFPDINNLSVRKQREIIQMR